jgi:hypothetical protein
MKVSSRKILAATAAGLAVAGGGAAVAASQNDSSSSFLDSLAQHLGISSEELEDAARAAAVDQVDAALAEGRITEEQADELRARIESGELPPFFGPGLFGGFHGHKGHGFGDHFSAAADYLGLTGRQLRNRLEDGRSLAEVAEAEGKSVDGLKQAIISDAKRRLDEAVADEDLTREQADAALERLEARVDELVEHTFEGRLGHRRFGGPPGGGRPDGGASLWGAAA